METHSVPFKLCNIILFASDDDLIDTCLFALLCLLFLGRSQNFIVSFQLLAMLVIPHIFDRHPVPLVDPGERLPVAQQ